jgi:hypothetical protein
VRGALHERADVQRAVEDVEGVGDAAVERVFFEIRFDEQLLQVRAVQNLVDFEADGPPLRPRAEAVERARQPQVPALLLV